jgi:hypothetical protein
MGVFAIGMQAFASDWISANGYSGLGVIPSASVLATGKASINFDTALPGSSNPQGYNWQVGFGLFDNVEVVTRLATHDMKCNFYVVFGDGECPSPMIRDLSGSFKLGVPLPLLNKYGGKLAIGVTDAAGAAVNFRSEYVVGSKSWNDFEFSLGAAKALSSTAPLQGRFGGVSWNPTSWSQLSVQQVGGDRWAHAGVHVPLGNSGTRAWITTNRQLNGSALTTKHWTSVGFSLPLERGVVTNRSAAPATIQGHKLIVTEPVQLPRLLKQYGFYNPKIGKLDTGRLVFTLENTSYLWDVLDAGGVAIALIASAYPESAQAFDLVLTTRGIPQLLIQGETACVKAWLESDTWCEKIQVQSLSTANYDDSKVMWEAHDAWSFRPEIALIPVLYSFIGTEVGAYDMDLGVNVNTVLPLWKGAYFDHAHVVPVNYRTSNFEPKGFFYAARLTEFTSRRLVHQLVSLPSLNTQMRATAGTAYRSYSGSQLETTTQSNNGRHRVTLTHGRFSNDLAPNAAAREYDLVSYRYVYGTDQKTSTEVTSGRFWGGDRGFIVGQRFWHGDTSLNAYIRKSRMSDNDRMVSFAGLSLNIPLTPRKNTGFSHLLFRGSNQFSYTVETKVGEKDNAITPGFGEVPAIGANVAQTLNRDRNSTSYYQSQIFRLKNAYLSLMDD